MDWDCGVKYAHQSACLRPRYRPDAEESEDVVEPVSVEIFAHLGEPCLPPSVAVLCHLVPVVGRESPILTVVGEVVGRCAGLTVEVVEARVYPGVNAVARDADWNVAFEDDAVFAGVVGYFFELEVQVVLNEEMHCNVVETCVVFVAEFIDHLRRICRKLSPFFKFGRVVEVAEITEHGVWFEPLLVVLEKFLVLRLLEEVAVVVVVDGLVDSRFHPHNLLVVDFFELVESRLLFEEYFFCYFARNFGHLAYSQVHRMERKHRNTVVRVRILPRMGEHGVVDGQELYHPQSHRLSPVDERNEIHKFANAKIFVAPEREHGDCHARALPRIAWELEVFVVQDVEILVLLRREIPCYVFFEDEFVGSLLADAVFVF